METREIQINNIINKGIIEANIEFAQNHNTPLSIVKFGYDVDLEDSFFFKDLISFIHSFSDFNSILQQPNDTFIIFLRDCKIHEAKSIITQMIQKIKFKFKTEITNIGITLLHENDTYKTLLDRLDKYYVMSKLSSKTKTFYGTSDFDFYETQSDKKVLNNIFKKVSDIKLYNFYQGLPITEKVQVLKFDQGLIQIKIDPIKLPFYEIEKFTFIQHDLIPAIIKASITKIEPNKSLMVLSNLEFLDSSPVERSGIRVEPERNIYASLSLENKKLLEGSIISLSENSVVLDVKPTNLETLTKNPLWNTELTLQFQIPTKKSFLTMVKTKAVLYSIINNKIVLNITPNRLIKSKLRTYIALRQTGLIGDLKRELKKFN
ncbi:hypothetical protein [Sulfurospirillum arcachonense]|uniref:hypothetical protein n=1 Tax=Sulfurospirillum arcachonense TaxID=57666 RepID=UPI000468D91B|nr:hypothetical protein [Sulfurospirillum arcachonense]